MARLLYYECLHISSTVVGLTSDAFRNAWYLARMPGLHFGAKPPFSLCVPVSAIQFEKYRGIWKSHVGLDQENSECFGNTIQPGNNLFMQQSANFIAITKRTKLFAVRSDAWCILVRDEV